MGKEVKFRITAVNTKLKAAVKGAAVAFKKLGRAAKDAGKVAAVVFRGIAKASKVALVAVAALGAGVIASIRQANQRAVLRIQFKTLVGDVEKAKALFKDLVEFSDLTPFTLDELTAPTKRLLTTGIAVEKVLPLLRKLGDTAASFDPSKLGEMSEFWAQFITQAKSGEGIIERDLIKSLVRLGVLLPEVGDEVSKLAKSGKKLEALAVAEKSLDRFEGGMATLSREVGGKWSTLVAKIQSGAVSIGDAFKKSAGAGLDGLIGAIDKATKSGALGRIGESIGKPLVTAFELAGKALDKFVAGGGLERLEGKFAEFGEAAEETVRDLFSGDQGRISKRISKLTEGLTAGVAKVANTFAEVLIARAPEIGAALLSGLFKGQHRRAKDFAEGAASGKKGKFFKGVVDGLKKGFGTAGALAGAADVAQSKLEGKMMLGNKSVQASLATQEALTRMTQRQAGRGPMDATNKKLAEISHNTGEKGAVVGATNGLKAQ